MKHKILIGSIIAVAILIGVSFTSVVGYSSVKSTNVEASPLFNIRTNRAINQEDDGLPCDYVGKGEENTITLPERNDEAYSIQQFIDRIKNMDDRTYNRFITSLLNYLKKKGYSNIKSDKILTEMNELRSYIKSNNITCEKIGEPQFYTEYLKECTFINWQFGCIMYKLLDIILQTAFLAFFIIFFIIIMGKNPPTIWTECPMECIKV